jgi:peptide/nickel transport system substrate-binding protein
MAWTLRPTITWHDGAPFTADDVVFGWQVQTDPQLPLRPSPAVPFIESVAAPDPMTVVVTWKEPYFNALGLGRQVPFPLPTHVLRDAYQGDPQTFSNLPYWTSEYVHLGPFRVVDFRVGESTTLERFDNYVLGPPRVDRIIVRVIPDSNAMMAYLLAGAVDIAAENTLSPDAIGQMRSSWLQDGGAIVQREGRFTVFGFQFNPEWARPAELGRDVRLRRALYFGMDREAIIEAALSDTGTQVGSDPVAEGSFMPRGDPRAPVVGKPFAEFRFDPARAVREMRAGGWVQDGDRVVNDAAAPVRISVRADRGTENVMAVAAKYWRDLRLEVTEEIVPGTMATDREYRSTFPAIELAFKGNGGADAPWRFFHSNPLPTPANRYASSNRGSYVNATYDWLTNQLYGSIDEMDQAQALRQLGELAAADLPFLPLYYEVAFAAVRKDVRALRDSFVVSDPGDAARLAHLWDRD